MKDLIPIVNKLQFIFSTVGAESLELPQIIAVGTQSSGKSSVVESIIGRDFLPRGQGMVTRRPLILQLICTRAGKTDEVIEMYGEFGHRPNIKYTDFEKICNEITAETNRLLSDEKDVSPEPIILKLFSPELINLTIVDLPGLTRISIGKQPIGLEKKIEDLTLQYISNKNSLILAVVPANIDIATSESLRLASYVDPKLERTIICLTKLDLMDKGTNAMDILNGKVVDSKIGIIGVVNRSQMDIENHKQAHVFEREFFETNYPSISHASGTKYLQKILSQVLSAHVQKCLPELKDRVQYLINKYKGLLNAYNCPISDKRFMLINIINRFVSIYCNIVRGSSVSMTTKELFGGSRIYYIFHEIFCKQIKSIDPLDGMSSDDILTAIINCKGMKTNLFFPEGAFEFLVKNQIKKFEQPSLDCVYLVSEEMTRITSQAFDQIGELMRYQNLKQQISYIVRSVVDEENDPTRKMIKNLVCAEMAYINTKHPDFSFKHESIYFSQFDELIPSDTLDTDVNHMNNISRIEKNTDFKTKQITILESLMCQYLKIVNHKIQDRYIIIIVCVPKYITCFLIDNIIDRIPDELVKRLLTDSSIEDLLVELPDSKAQRESKEKMLTALLKANELIAQIKNTST